MTRRQAREEAFFILFEHCFSAEPASELVQAAKLARDLEPNAYLEQVTAGTLGALPELDAIIQRYLSGWKLPRISKVCLSLLRLALYEMRYVTEIPTGVSINEAVELCKKYATEEDAAYLNGILGAYAKELEGK